MSVSLDTVLSSLNIDLEDLEGLSADEIEAKISEALPEGLSADGLTELKADILTELSELENEWEELLDGEEDDYDDSETEEGKARAERNMEEINESLDLLATFEDALDDPLEHELLLYREESGNEAYFTTEGLNDGDAVTVKCTGTQATTESMWDEDETEETEVEAGEDGVVTYADYEAAWAAEASASTAQMPFLGAAGETYTLAEDGADYTVFNVTDAGGNTYSLRTEGKPAIYFEPGTVSLDAISGYSEDLAKRCYERGDTVSFYDHLDTDDMGETEKLAYVETYSDVVNSTTFDTAWAEVSKWISIEDSSSGTSAATAMSLSADGAYNYYKSALDQLYGWFNEGSDKGSIEAVWSDIFAQWEAVPLSDNDITAIIETMVLGLFNGGNQTMFQSIMGPAIGNLETYISTDGESTAPLNEFDKMIILLLETHSGGFGLGGGPEIWTNGSMTTETTDADGNVTYTKGSWLKDSAENAAAIEMYKTQVFGSWTLESANADTQIAIEKGKIDSDDAAEDAAAIAEANMSDSELNDIKNFITKHAIDVQTICSWAGYLSIDQDDVYKLEELFISLQTSTNYYETITNFFDSAEYGDETDDMASTFVLILGYYAPSLAETILSDGETNRYLRRSIIDGGTNAFGGDVTWHTSLVYDGIDAFRGHTSVAYLDKYA